MRTSFLRAAVIAALVPTSRIAAQGRHEIVRGRVVSDSGRAVRGAQVIVIRAQDSAFKSSATDSLGRYSTDWPDGRGVYTVGVTAPGFAPTQLHVTRGASADSVLVADVRLATSGAQRLAAVVSRATRPVPDRDPTSFDAGGSTSSTIAQNTARRMSPDLAGDINAIASMMPGITPVTGGGISVLGLSPSQNSVTLNGLSFSGTDIPRDATTRVRVQASSYDPANGWFSGANTALDLVIGGQFTSRSTHITADMPALEYNDPIAARLGQRMTNVNASLGGNGQLVDDKWAYNYGVQGGRKLSSVSSLVTADADVLEHAGVSPDSVTHLLATLRQAGIPSVVGGIPSGLLNDDVSFIGRIDHAPYDWNTSTYNPVTWGLQGYGKWGRTQAQGISPIGTPAHAGTTTQLIGSTTAFYTALFKNTYLADFRSAVTATENKADPYLALPDARALVVSQLPGGTGGISTLQFGGNSALNNDSRNWRWETSGQVQFYPPSFTKHRVKLAGDVRLDTYSQDPLANSLGTFSFLSLGDVAANRPAMFTRTLNTPTRTGGEWNSFVSLGDQWRVMPNLQLVYGARVDASAFTKLPAYNAALDRALGVRTNEAPSSADVSPRLGFTWQNGKGKIIRGGVGEFRNLLDPSLLAAPSVSTGLPGGLLNLSCIGVAVPTPDWSAFAADASSIPTRCVGTSGVLADTAPNVQLVRSSFRPQKSWRGNLGYQTSAFRWVYTLEGLGSLNLDQRGVIDRNFSTATSFIVPLENRPVFATPTAVVPNTGTVSSVVARRTPSFGQVLDLVSNLQSRSAQAVLDVRPYIPQGLRPYFGDVDFSYTLTSIRAEQRGFDGATFGDPNGIEWARGDLDSRHQLLGLFVFRPLGDARIITYGSFRFRSGLPFTPMIASDVNADGLANDRAFIFNPATAGDSSLAAGLRTLMSSAPSRVRECLNSQLGQAAGRNSCEGPWVSSMNLGVRLSGQQLLHMPRADVTLNLTNPLGGLDQLLHGANNLHGWGTAAAPDPTLYTVRGFDPATNRYQYVVNPRFGSTSPAITTLRAPFRLTLDVSIDVARPMSEQQLDRWLRPGRSGRPGTKLTAADFTRRYARVVPDPFAELLQQSDSLLLSVEEVRALQDVDATYRARVDAIWKDLGEYLGNLPDNYDFDAAARHTDDVIDDVWEITRLDDQRELARILAPAQTALLSGWAGVLFRARDRLHVRLAPRAG